MTEAVNAQTPNLSVADRSQLTLYAANECFPTTSAKTSLQETKQNHNKTASSGMNQVMKRRIADISNEVQLSSYERKTKKIELVGMVTEGFELEGEHTTKAIMERFLDFDSDEEKGKVDDILGVEGSRRVKKVFIINYYIKNNIYYHYNYIYYNNNVLLCIIIIYRLFQMGNGAKVWNTKTLAIYFHKLLKRGNPIKQMRSF